MKKLLAILLALVLALSLFACADNGKDEKENGGETSTATQAVESREPVDVLKAVWANYKDDQKFAVAGGDTENMVMDEPGAFNIANTEELDVALGFPATAADKIDAAASIVHMMNANTFTCGAYRVKNAADVQVVAAALKDNILNRHWMCGFPDTLIIAQVDDVVIACFGNYGNPENFKLNLTEVFDSAVIISEDPIE